MLPAWNSRRCAARSVTLVTLLGLGLPVLADTGCGAPAVSLSTVQGPGNRSPRNGQTVTVEAVVTGAFAEAKALAGVFLEEEPADQDHNPATSEGLFVYAPGVRADVGDVLRVTGQVREYHGLTEIVARGQPQVCGQQSLPPPQPINPGAWTPGAPESLEAMRVSLAKPLTVTGVHELAYYGSLILAPNRQIQPTQLLAPGSAARRYAKTTQAQRLILDDGSSQRHPESLYRVGHRPPRVGDRVTAATGVLDYRFGQWRLQPTRQPTLTAGNARPQAPARAQGTTLRVVSFNVENFFNGNGQGGGFPTARGADTINEEQNQRQHLVATLKALDADIIGLQEVENDGYGPHSAIAELASALGSEWRYARPGQDQAGTDAIAPALLYRSDRVTARGEAQVIAAPAFRRYSRPPLVQLFQLADGSDLRVAVNHFKSRRCAHASDQDRDQHNGAGCWNAARTGAARALVRALGGHKPTLILGDLNSYAQEEPVRFLVASGYRDLIGRFAGDAAYSYVYHGYSGYMDYALASAGLLDRVLATRHWHSNADESPSQALRAADAEYVDVQDYPWGASDHDPVVVDIGQARP